MVLVAKIYRNLFDFGIMTAVSRKQVIRENRTLVKLNSVFRMSQHLSRIIISFSSVFIESSGTENHLTNLLH
jgi:hypothetical protein